CCWLLIKVDVEHLLDSEHDVLGHRQSIRLQRLCVRHGHVGAGHSYHRSVEISEPTPLCGHPLSTVTR
ncbi:hypothetical protein TYRP_013481, partial [Tyrophagus putrescentiae]